ncbi:3-hydroxyacyl-CoA dehydratase PASTICCINO 2A [Sesbania bispinosa]|nr:3-hydroxyacyl-CoA dehydratase PASTICCINO 2A [Sesbania bispinosa]
MAGFFSLLRRLYLTLYNWTVFFGWVQVLYLVLKTLKESGHEHVYTAAEKPLLFAQTAAVLELLLFFWVWCYVAWRARFFMVWAGEVSNNSNIATDKFKAVPGLGNIVEFP